MNTISLTCINFLKMKLFFIFVLFFQCTLALKAGDLGPVASQLKSSHPIHWDLQNSDQIKSSLRDLIQNNSARAPYIHNKRESISLKARAIKEYGKIIGLSEKEVSKRDQGLFKSLESDVQKSSSLQASFYQSLARTQSEFAMGYILDVIDSHPTVLALISLSPFFEKVSESPRSYHSSAAAHGSYQSPQKLYQKISPENWKKWLRKVQKKLNQIQNSPTSSDALVKKAKRIQRQAIELVSARQSEEKRKLTSFLLKSSHQDISLDSGRRPSSLLKKDVKTAQKRQISSEQKMNDESTFSYGLYLFFFFVAFVMCFFYFYFKKRS